MIKRLAALAALIPALLFGQSQTVTQNLGLYIPGYNQANWQVPLDYNFNLIDKLISVKVSLLAPAASVPGMFLWIGDGTSATDCSVGGGNFAVACKSNGSAWVAIGSGSGGGTGGGGLPSCSANQLPYYAATGTTAACLTLGTNLSITAGVMNAAGGGGGSTPMTTPGDMIIENNVPAPDRLPGNTSTIPAFLMSTGTGTFAGLPVWNTTPPSNKLNYLYGAGSVPGMVSIPLTWEVSSPNLLGINAGMTCDGNTDDQPAIEALVTALGSVATVDAPATLLLSNASGNACDVASPIVVSVPNIHIKGNRGSTVIQAKTNSWLPYVFDIQASNVTLSGLTLDGNIANQGVGWFLAAWCGVVGGTDSFGVPSTTPGSYCPTVASGAPVPIYDKCGAGDSEGGGNPSGCTSAIIEGGPDTVGSIQGGTLYVYKALAHGQNLPLPTGAASNGNWGYMTTITNPKVIAAPSSSGMLVRLNNVSHVHLDDIEMKNSQFGIYAYAFTGTQSDIRLTNSWCHDFGVQFQGNNSDLDCVHSQTGGGNRIQNVWIDNNLFENIFIPVTGPGNTSSIFVDANGVTFTNNRVTDSINRGGGVIAPARPGNGQWTVANNKFSLLNNFNGSFAEAIETQESYSTFTGNSVFGYVQCMGQSNLPGDNVGNNTWTGNMCYGAGPANNSSGMVLTSAGTGVQDYNTTVSGNIFDNYNNGLWIACQGVGCTPLTNIAQTGNVFQNNATTDIYDPFDALAYEWLPYTPTLTITSGGATWSCNVSPFCVGQYRVIGKTVYYQAQLSGTYVGNASVQNATISLPIPTFAGANQLIPVQISGHGVTTSPLYNSFAAGSVINLSFLLNTASGTNFFFVGGSYQSQ